MRFSPDMIEGTGTLEERALRGEDLSIDEWRELAHTKKGNWDWNDPDDWKLSEMYAEAIIEHHNKIGINESIRRLYESIKESFEKRGHPPPTTIVMGMLTFKKWFYYCEENDINYKRWKGKQVIIDKTSPPRLLAVTSHPEQDIMEKAKEEGL